MNRPYANCTRCASLPWQSRSKCNYWIPELSFEERFGILVDLEWSRRKNNRLTILIRKADFQLPNASIEDIEYHADRKLDRTQILRLETSAYIHDKLNVINMGASGARKTYLACAFGI